MNKMKNTILLLLLLFLGFNVKALSKELYSQEIGNNTVIEMQEKWVSNNDRVFLLDMVMDGDESKIYKYLFYSNLYKNSEYVKKSSNKRGLNDGEYLEININDLDIDVNSYDDIRLNLGYLIHSLSYNIVNYYSLKVYTIDENNIEHGPYYLGDYIPTGYYNQKNTEVFFRGYNLITQNLNDGSYSKIKSIKIVPYGNLPLEIDPNETYESDWRNQASRFYLGSLKVIGYKDEKYKNPNVEYQSVNVNDLKLNIAKRMYDTATIKWIPDIDMHSLHAVGGVAFRENVLYKAGEVNYGMPYTQRNRVTIEKYNNELDSNYNINSIKDLEGNQSIDFYGQDCASSVSYSITKYIPLPSLAGVTDYIWNRLNTKLLGDLEIDGTDQSSLAPYNKLCEKYKNPSNYNDFSESVLESAERESKSRIKSNTSKIKYVNKFYIGNEIYDYLTYYEEGVNNNKPLTLTLDDQNITSQELLITMVYHKYDGASDLNPIFKINNEVVASSEQSSNKIHTYTSSGSKVGIYEKVYKITLDSNQSITKLEFLPYGESVPSTKVFRMSNFIVKSNEETFVNISTAKYDFYYDISSNFKGDENDIYALKDDFISAFNGDFTSNYYSGYDSEEKMIKAKFLASQKIFNAYMQLNVGDTVNTQSKSGSIHIRLITGSTYVECLDGYVLGHDNEKVPNIVGTCDSHGGINPLKSYYIRTDISSSPVKTNEENKNNYGGLINEDDFVASKYWTPNSKYTDINSLSDLENKNLNFMINTKNSFLDGLKKSYLPTTLNSYITGKVEKPYALLINGNTDSNISDGFKGTIYSNYPIIKLNFYLKNNKTNEEKKYSIYPSHAPNYPNQDQDINNKTYSRENQFSNYYSLYYNLPLDNTEINTQLKEIVNSSDGDYIVEVSVDSGTSEDMKILSLIPKGNKDKTVESPNTGIKKYSIIGLIIALAGFIIVYKRKIKISIGK